MPPYYIQVALICATRGNAREEIDRMYPPSRVKSECLDWMLANELIVDPRTCEATDKLRAWAAMICETPLPVIKWCAPDAD